MSTGVENTVSIIVPVYNVEQFLPQCIDSLLVQTLTNLEILLVDDGSTDSSGAICEEYASGHPQVKVIHKKNGGLMSAWKAGAAAASGGYLGFVDSDDWVEPEMFLTLYEKAEETNADLVLCGFIREYDGYSTLEEIHPETGYYGRDRIRSELLPKLINFGPMLERYVSPNRVTKLIRKSLLMNNLSFCDERISLGEDFVATFPCILDAKCLFVMQEYHPYHYRIRGTSIMGSYNPKLFEHSVLLNQQLKEIAEAKGNFDFSVQLASDFVSLVFYGIERNISAAPEKGKEICRDIKSAFQSRYFQESMARQIITENSSKCKAYEWFIRLHWYTGLYLFIRYVVFAKRKFLGY